MYGAIMPMLGSYGTSAPEQSSEMPFRYRTPFQQGLSMPLQQTDPSSTAYKCERLWLFWTHFLRLYMMALPRKQLGARYDPRPAKSGLGCLL